MHLNYTGTNSPTIFAAVEDWHLEQGGTYVLSVSFGLGTAAADTVLGSHLADGITVLGGNDQVLGGSGDDTIQGGLGVTVWTAARKTVC